MLIIWLAILTLISSWLGFSIIINPILRAQLRAHLASDDRSSRMQMGRGMHLTVFILALFVMIAAALLLSLLISISVALVITSLVSFVFASFAYFILQRFADPLRRSAMVRSHPLFTQLWH